MKKQWKCLRCGYIGPMGTYLRRSGPQLIAIIGILFFLIPGIIFMAAMAGKRRCPRCGSINQAIPSE